MWKTGLKPRHASKGPPTLRKDANKALETHHTSEADAPTHQPKGGKNKKNQGRRGFRSYAGQVALPSSGSGEKCKHCSNPGHITPRKAAERRGESEGLLAEFAQTGAACKCRLQPLRCRGHQGRISQASPSGTCKPPQR